MGAPGPCCFALRFFLTASGVASGLLAVAANAVAGQADAKLEFNQTFRGWISSVLDEDLVEFEEVKGSLMTITLTRDGGNRMRPMIELLDETMTVIPLGSALKLTSRKAQIRDFPAPHDGTYFVRLSTITQTGTYKVKFKGKPPKKARFTETIGVAAEIDELIFSVRAGSKISGTIQRVSGDLEPSVIEIEGADGNLVSIGGKTHLNAARDKLTLSGIRIPAVGECRLRLTGLGGTTGDYKVHLTIKSPRPAKGTVFEGEDPDPPDGNKQSVTLKGIRFGRGLRLGVGPEIDVVSPFSTLDIDPVSTLPIPGTLKPLFAGGDLSRLVGFNLGPVYGPPVVPRNAVLVLKFTRPVDEESLKLDANSQLTPDSPLVVTVNGEFVAAEVTRKGKRLMLNPVAGDEVGFPASPLALDANGNPMANVLGVAKIQIISTGVNALRSASGGRYAPRDDLLGSSDVGGSPIGFNPGNEVLDFFAQSGAGAGASSFGGFLPDFVAPRIIRELTFAHNFAPDYLDPGNGDQQGPTWIDLVLTFPFDTNAKFGAGEWAQGILVLRPGGVAPEVIPIARNTVQALGDGRYRNTILLADNIRIPLGNGQPLELVRAEYFEPDPNNPIDPDLFDPFNPELSNNADLSNFLVVEDRNGQAQDINLPIDPLSTFSMLFSEAMQVDSFKPYETFYVSDNPHVDNPGLNKLGRVVATRNGRRMTFHPDRIIQFGASAGSAEPVGLGSGGGSFLMHLQVVPSADILKGLLGEQGMQDFLDEGELGVTDVGGQSLAIPPNSLSSSDPLVDYTVPFTTFTDAGLVDWTAVVQRFKGRPSTGFDGGGNTGLTYRDVPLWMTNGSQGANLYGPRIADLNIFSNGHLSGAPVQFLTKIHDDFNPPETGNFGANPFGAATPIGSWSVLGGAKSQHVFRATDASPDWRSLAGTKLDLISMSYAPIGLVTNTTIPDISIHIGHSSIVPDTEQTQGIPRHEWSGLRQTMEANYDAVENETGIVHQRQLVVGTEISPGSFQGVAFEINRSNVYAPRGTDNAYHPIPNEPFDRAFVYNNGSRDVVDFNTGATMMGGGYVGTPTWPSEDQNQNRPESLLVEYRIRIVDTSNPPALSNGFTYALGILSSALPRFRVFSYGAGCMSCCAPTGTGTLDCLNTCTIAYGPALNSPATTPTGFADGGPPLEPDLVTHAAGPAPAPPGLPCICLASMQNPRAPNPNCTQDNTVYSPSIDMVATGTPLPTGVNFGDNTRYFMLFDYVKRESYVISPFVRIQPTNVIDPIYHAPVFDPPLDILPEGTSVHIRFRSSLTGFEGTATNWVTPTQMGDVNNPINTEASSGPYLQFDAVLISNTSTQISPIFNDIVVPLETGL